MKISYNLNHIYILLLFLFLAQYTAAQENPPLYPASLELLEQTSLWKKSNNAAGLQIDRPFKYALLVAGYEGYGGNFNRPQQGSSGDRQSVQTEGNLFTGGYYLSGSFSYLRDNIRNASYNASIIEPFRGMPYILADLNSSNWNNQHYNLQFKLATPTYNNRWSFGLAGVYTASSGAKQRDIRAENYYYSISVAPAMVYSPSKRHHIGLNLTYGNAKEESRMSNVNTYIDQAFYDLLGLGNAIAHFGSGSTYNYEGDAIGAGLQYHIEGNIGVFLSAAYRVEAEDLKESFNAPRDGGSVLRKMWDSKLSLQRKGSLHTHFIDFTYYNREIDGIQYVTQRDNTVTQQGWISLFKNIRSAYSTQRAAVQYSLVANRDNEYAWKINTNINYEKLEDRYFLPNSVKAAENIRFTVSGKKNFILSKIKNKRLETGVEFNYNSNISGQYSYSGEHADYPTVMDLEQNDLNYLTADYLCIGVPLTYSQQLNTQNNRVFFVKANGQYIHTNSFDYTKHYMISVHAGINF